MQCSGDEKFSPPADEVESLDWVSVADFEKMIQENQQDFTPSFLRIYKFWKNSKS
jgi:isopentenyldiphosphate isomerase